jgi:clan AA aspartic protease (TIGR02281 family)
MKRAALYAALALGACSSPPPAPAVTVAAPVEAASVRVPMLRSGADIFTVQVAVAGTCCLPFLLDSGASDVSVSPALFAAMVEGGHVTSADLIDVDTYVTASGKVEGLRFRMPPLTVGGITLHGVAGSVTPGAPDGMLLLGQSFLRRFRAWSIDNETNELVLR